MSARVVSYTDALMWLNDRRGKHATAAVEFDSGDTLIAVASHEGDLDHWSRDELVSEGVLAAPREDLLGLYHVGAGFSIDLTGLDDAGVVFEVGGGIARIEEDGVTREQPFGQVVVRLDDRVRLRVTVVGARTDDGEDLGGGE